MLSALCVKGIHLLTVQEDHCPAEFRLIHWFRCVCLGLELNTAGQWPTPVLEYQIINLNIFITEDTEGKKNTMEPLLPEGGNTDVKETGKCISKGIIN